MFGSDEPGTLFVLAERILRLIWRRMMMMRRMAKRRRDTPIARATFGLMDSDSLSSTSFVCVLSYSGGAGIKCTQDLTLMLLVAYLANTK